MTDEQAIKILSDELAHSLVERLEARAQMWRGAISPLMREHAYYIQEAANRICELETAAKGSADLLHTLSMATTGVLRGQICTASNQLDAALGRGQSLHGAQF